MTANVATSESAAVMDQPSLSVSTVGTASARNVPAHKSSNGRASRITLQNRKKWPTTKPITIPHHPTSVEAPIAAIRPTTIIAASRLENLNPGENLRVCVVLLPAALIRRQPGWIKLDVFTLRKVRGRHLPTKLSHKCM